METAKAGHRGSCATSDRSGNQFGRLGGHVGVTQVKASDLCCPYTRERSIMMYPITTEAIYYLSGNFAVASRYTPPGTLCTGQA